MAFINFGKLKMICEIGTSIEAFIESQGIDSEDVYVTYNGKIVTKSSFPKQDEIFYILPRVLGGKGGFGSMLRALGAQIEKTTNREACRDLSGRRMRDVNQEQQLRDWVAKKAEREQERAQKRRERAEKRRSILQGAQKHQFEDKDYHRQKMKVLEQLDDALQQGLLNAKTSASAASSSSASSSSESQKRKGNETNDGPSAKKTCEWLGIDIENMSDFDTDSDSSSDDGSSEAQSDNPEKTPLNTEIIATQEINVDKKGDTRTTDNTTITKSPEKENNATPVAPDQVTSEGKSNDKAVNGKDEDMPTSNIISTESTEKVIIEDGPLDLEKFDSVADLEALGLDRLKSALTSLGLKCGGTLQQRAERLWAIKGKALDKIDPKLFARPFKSKKKE